MGSGFAFPHVELLQTDVRALRLNSFENHWFEEINSGIVWSSCQISCQNPLVLLRMLNSVL